MQKLLKLFSAPIFCLLLNLPVFQSSVLAESNFDFPILAISEIQTGGLDTENNEVPASEFVELKNTTDQPLDLSGWKVEYLSGSGNPQGNPLAVLSGTIEPHGYVLIAHTSYMATDGISVDFRFGTGTNSVFGKTVGQVRVVDSAAQTTDQVAWGSASVTGAWPLLPAISPGYSVKRIFPGGPLYGLGFQYTSSTLPVTPQGGGYFALSSNDTGDGTNTGVDTGDDTPNNDDSQNAGGQGAGSQASCDGLIVNELLPNPTGTDTGREFIELYNPTEDIIPLSGCKLQTSANTKIYEFTDGQLLPGQYQAFYNDKTGLTLANSGGGSVYLIDSDGTEIYQVDYATDLDDDVSWSLIEGDWMRTFSATPNKANELLENKPCPSGQVRNTDTNRCINIVTEIAGLSPCPAGKERNPDTNRCRSIASLASVLKACAANQTRNPATGRCKKNSNTSALSPCKPGQERNPDTHRCRKSQAASSSGINDVKDVLSVSSQSDHTNWGIAALSVFGAVLYAVWEWRSEIVQQLGILRGKFS